jgi:hypothetical protein
LNFNFMKESVLLRAMRGMPALKCAWWMCVLLMAATSVSALEFVDAKWGFDGEVVPNRFNLLSVLVVNPSETPFDGAITCYKSRGLESRVGAVYSTACYVSPQTTRWVQFYVYIDNEYDKWRLEWGRGPKDRKDFDDAPKWGGPARVLLAEIDSTEAIVSTFKQFPEELFPPTASATSGLDSVLLDHAPRWEPVKRRAFLNWLRAGGKVHLLMGADGHYPVFSDELSVLNTPTDRQRIGAGIAVRHAVNARNIKKQDIEQGEIPPRALKNNDPNAYNETADAFLRGLAQLSRRRYSWEWIFLLAVVYVGLVGPGNFVWGRKLRDYRLRIGLLLAMIGAFAWLFNVVGRRGQGEASFVHTLSYARAIDGDTYDVMQWINVFATHGADYKITHAAPDNLYATGQDYESVNGWIQSGKDGMFMVDIPMFSRRGLVHEAEMKGVEIPVKIIRWDGTDSLRQLALTVGPDFTRQVLDGWVVQGTTVYPMKLSDGQLVFDQSRRETFDSFFSPAAMQQNGPYYGGGPYGGYRYGGEEVITNIQSNFQKLARPLMSWSLETKDLQHAPASVVEGHAELFLFARSPAGFGIAGNQFNQEIGYVLYHLDLFKPQ